MLAAPYCSLCLSFFGIPLAEIVDGARQSAFEPLHARSGLEILVFAFNHPRQKFAWATIHVWWR